MQEQGQARYSLEDAQRRLRIAERQLDDLGPIRRRSHGNTRHEIKQRITTFEAEITRADDKLTALTDELRPHEPLISQRHTWEHEHRTETDNVAQLDHQIDMAERLDRLTVRALERTVEVDRGLGLGL